MLRNAFTYFSEELMLASQSIEKGWGRRDIKIWHRGGRPHRDFGAAAGLVDGGGHNLPALHPIGQLFGKAISKAPTPMGELELDMGMVRFSGAVSSFIFFSAAVTATGSSTMSP